MSRADVYDSQTNPEGTQRDLNMKHAREAYNYALNPDHEGKRFWPEIVLNIRRLRGVKVDVVSKAKGGGEFVKIHIDLNLLELREVNPSISRVDGNHRLHFAAGDQKRKLKPLTHISGPFAITLQLSREQELRIFRDINKEQKPMNTSHLDNIFVRLSPAEKLFGDNPNLWLSQELSRREGSPFRGKVYSGGKRLKGLYLINLRGLESAISELRGASQHLRTMKESEIAYKIIENYWNAVKTVWPVEWSDTKNFKLMTNTPGLTSLGRAGGQLLETQLRKQKVKLDDLVEVVAQFKSQVNWAKDSDDMKGMAGPGAAKRVAETLEKGLPDEVDLEALEV
jgi:DGQHR domain-containing protein